MKIIEQSYQLLPDQEDLVQQIGSRASICYQADGSSEEANIKRVLHCLKNGHMSALEMARICFTEIHYPNSKFLEHGITENYTSGSIRAFMETGYRFEEILDWNRIECPSDHPDYKYHKFQCVKFITNRAMTHELVRHRNNTSFLQESQRYVRYDKPGGIEFVKPLWLNSDGDLECWEAIMQIAETSYIGLLNEYKLSPQQARGVLPNDIKTEIIVYTSLAEWRHIFYQRCSPGADPMMRALMTPVLGEFRVVYPRVFEHLKPSVAGR